MGEVLLEKLNMAVSIPNPKRASAIAFLNGDSNGSDAMYSSTNDPLSLNSRTDNQDILGDWRGVSSALDINLDNRELGAERGNLPLSNVHTPFDVIGSESTLLDTVIQKASTPLPFGSERTSSTPLDNAFGIWGQGLGVPNPVKAKALMLDDGWDLTFSPPGLAGNDRIQSVGPLGSPSALSQLSSHRPLSTPIYSSGGAYGELLNSGSVDQSFGSGKLTSHLSTSALEALNGINNLVTEQDWSRQSRPINSLNDILENPFICSGAPAGALGGVISLEGAAGLYKVPNNSANFLERTPSAPLFDSNPYAFHGGVLRGSTPVGGNLSSGNLAGLLPRSTTPSQHPNSLHHGHFAHQNSFTNSSPNKLSFRGVDDSAVENVVANTCHQILLDAMYHSLKAVELANTLRARVG